MDRVGQLWSVTLTLLPLIIGANPTSLGSEALGVPRNLPSLGNEVIPRVLRPFVGGFDAHRNPEIVSVTISLRSGQQWTGTS